MRRFARLLDETRRELDLPYPAKAAVLEELATDLEALYEHYRARGDDELSALRKARERLVASAEAAAELAELHLPLYGRLVRRFSDRSRGRLERAILLVLVLGLMAAGIVAAGPRRVLAAPPHFTVPFAATLAGIAAIGITKAFQLYVRRDHRIDRLRTGLLPLAVLTAAAPLIGLLAAAIELYTLAAMLSGNATAAATAAAVDPGVWRGIAQASTQVSVGLAAALAGALCWFGLSVQAARIEAVERAFSRTAGLD